MGEFDDDTDTRDATPEDETMIGEITRLRTALAAARNDALEEAAKYMETRFALGVGDYAAVKIRELKEIG